MDDRNQRRRQNDVPYPNPSSNPSQRYAQDTTQGRGFTNTSSERFRAPPVVSSPAGARGVAASASGYGYFTDPAPAFPATLPSNAIQYQPEYSPDQRQQQGVFSPYSSNLMYSVTQQATQNTVYDSGQQFQTRQPTSIQLIPDAAAPYYPSESPSVPPPPVLQQQVSPASSTVYQQNSTDRSTLIPNYPGNIGNLTSVSQVPESMSDQEYIPGTLDEAYTRYQTALKGIFQNIVNGMLIEASLALVEVSDWLLTHVGELGLTLDDLSLRNDRLKLWDEFNHAWLAVMQKQKDLTLEILRTGHAPRNPASLIPYDFLEKMGRELVRLCDNVERHGLVDYQYGVWEERIITILIECLDLLQTNSNRLGDSAGEIPLPNPNHRLGKAPS